MSLIDCKLTAISISKHVQNLYCGFVLLHKRGLIDISQAFDSKIAMRNDGETHLVDARSTHLIATINNKIKVHYDNHDSWEIDEEYLHRSDVYFKRSYAKDKLMIHGECIKKIYPLGLNYQVFAHSFDKYALARCLRLGSLGEKYYTLIGAIKFLDLIQYVPRINYLESLPSDSMDPKILFMVRAWDPFDCPERSKEKVEERKEINEMRASCLNLLKKEFKNRFYGGFMDDNYSRNSYRNLLVPDNSTTIKGNYIKLLKSYPICIATTGLHGSIGWKFAEYVALSKAIVSEKLNYTNPGDFAEGKNYLEFNTPHECIDKAEKLMSNKELRSGIMMNNGNYYLDYMRPDSLVLNSIITALYSASLD